MASNMGDMGRGAGKSGGSGGSIRDAGGAFGKRQAAHEEEYFYNLQKEQVKAMRIELEEKLRAKMAAKKPLTEEEKLALAHAEQLEKLESHHPD
ncbi:unnamed protein product [Toxocara canis]|uniref:ATPase inhibitor, mitochondrial n=1 Tax=Toxocara canis TaxID=6265 RepID=A0A3P7GMC3_TOXCA|nr:unnamed protein product [Toxocara canis]